METISIFKSDKEAQEFFQYWRDLKQWSDETTIAWMVLNPYQIKGQVQAWRDNKKQKEPLYFLKADHLAKVVLEIENEWDDLIKNKLANAIFHILEEDGKYINIDNVRDFIINSIEDLRETTRDYALTPLATAIIVLDENIDDLFIEEVERANDFPMPTTKCIECTLEELTNTLTEDIGIDPTMIKEIINKFFQEVPQK